MIPKPRVLLALNATEEEAGDLWPVERYARQGGLDLSLGFDLSDLRMAAEQDEFDVAVVDLSFYGVHFFVKRLVAESPRPIAIATTRIFHGVRMKLATWAIRHIPYQCGEQYYDELRALADEYGPQAPPTVS